MGRRREPDPVELQDVVEDLADVWQHAVMKGRPEPRRVRADWPALARLLDDLLDGQRALDEWLGRDDTTPKRRDGHAQSFPATGDTETTT